VEKVDAYMPVFVGDYLRDTMHLSLEEHGAYLKLLFVMWGQGHGRLPSDPTRLARMVGCDRAEWDRVWPAIAGYFDLDVAGGFITQGRLVQELEAARQRKRTAAENGRKGGEEKARRAKESGGAVAGVIATLQAPPVAGPLATLQAEGVANAWQKPTSPSPSESSSASGSPASASPAQSDARAGDPTATELVAPAPGPAARPKWRSGYEWLEAFRIAWRDVYHVHYGNTSDGKAVRDLEDLVLANMPDDEGEHLWGQRKAFFGRFLASRDPRVVQGKHAFVLLVARFSDFRPDLATLGAPAAGAGSLDRPCDFHAGAANQGKQAAKLHQKPATCAECRHLQARASPRAAGEPTAMGELIANVMPGR
jgi:uncharacterized protein YdaU (DUF1376 family)